MAYQPIENYGIIGDMHSTPSISRHQKGGLVSAVWSTDTM